MPDPSTSRKRVVVHVGPHKTGSTALQSCLSANHSLLLRKGVLFLHDKSTHDAAMHLAQEDFEAAESILSRVAKSISEVDAQTVLLSQEDFSGDLPGRSRRKSIYPKLTKNLRIIARALQPHKVEFVFFTRDEGSWLASCYKQNLKHRTSFSSFTEFQAHFDEGHSWAEKLERPIATFKEAFVMVPYSKNPDAGITAILEIIGQKGLKLSFPPKANNTSPDSATTKLLERINTFSSYKQTAWFSKALVMQNWKPRISIANVSGKFTRNSDLASMALPALTRRANARISNQSVSDVLPARDCDLFPMLFEVLPPDATLPSVSRARMEDQSAILDYHFRGQSRLAKLNGLTISYLRRSTQHTDKARHLFHRIWREQGVLLVNELPTRWLISTLQTFLDHGENEAQRLIGASGHFYANMLKIYEGERAIEGLQQDAIYKNAEPSTPNRFAGLDRYNVGGTDLLLNTNALALDLAMRDDVAGLVLIELLLRVQSSGNVFTRMDNTRRAMGISVQDFSDTWSFFEPPKKTG